MKRIINYIPLHLVVFLILGICIQHFIPIRSENLFGLSIAVVVILVVLTLREKFRLRTSLLFVFWCGLTTTVIGINSYQNTRQLQWSDHFSNCPDFEVEKQLEFKLRPFRVLRPNKDFYRYEARIIEMTGVATTGKVIVSVERTKVQGTLKLFDDYLVWATVKEVSAPKNPNTFNYKNYLYHRQIYHQVVLDEKALIKHISNVDSSPLSWAADLRERILKNLTSAGFNKEELALVSAVLLGQREGLSADLITNFSNAGVMHILAVSGLHVGILFLVLSMLFKPLKLLPGGQIIASIFIVVMLWVFALLAGLSVSVIRSVTMFSLVALALTLRREFNVYQSLICSMFILLLLHPDYLFTVGFQMSYLAVFSIVWIQPKIAAFVRPKGYLLAKLWQLLTVSLAAQVGVFPISLYYFHQFPSLFLLANLIVIPFLSLFLIIGIVLIIGTLIHLVPSFLVLLYQKMIGFINSVVSWIGSLEYFVLEEVYISELQLLVIYVFLAGSFRLLSGITIKKIQLALGCLLLMSVVFMMENIRKQRSYEWLVFNSYRSSMIAVRNGKEVYFYTSDSTQGNRSVAKNYLKSVGLNTDLRFRSLPSLLHVGDSWLVVVDSSGLYNFKSVSPDIVLLQQSPAVHLEQVLKVLSPSLVIADGSNYPSDVDRWAVTCSQQKTPFHATAKKGVYTISY